MKARFVLVFLLVAGCASAGSPKCQEKPLTRRQLIQIVESAIKKQGGAPSPKRRSRIKIKRDGCDYLYHEVTMPRKPGGFFFVRINEHGEVVDLLHGL